MIKPKYKDIYDNPIWELYECDNGARWAAAKGGPYSRQENDECHFSGCPKGHYVHIKGETRAIAIAHKWFRKSRHPAQNSVFDNKLRLPRLLTMQRSGCLLSRLLRPQCRPPQNHR